MAKFIELHERREPRLINLDWVEEVRPEGRGATVYFAFEGKDYAEQDNMVLDESYEEVRDAILCSYGERKSGTQPQREDA